MAEQQSGSNAFVKAFIPGLIIGFIVGAAVGVVISATGGNIGALTESNEPTITDRTPSGDREFGELDRLEDAATDAAESAGQAIEDGADAVRESVEEGVDAVRDAINDPEADRSGG